MMNLGELADRLMVAAKIFSNKRLVTEVLPQISGQEISEESVKNFIIQFFKQVELPNELRIILEKKLNDYAKDSLISIKRNNYMNDYKKGNTFDIVSAEAILVDYINYVCLPLNLGFRTKDLFLEVVIS